MIAKQQRQTEKTEKHDLLLLKRYIIDKLGIQHGLNIYLSIHCYTAIYFYFYVYQAYVHDVYEQISSHISVDSRYRGAWPRVKKFVQELEPGSVVCDVGCGNGKYLNINPDIFVIGSDRCLSLAQTAREKDLEVSFQ